MSSNPAGPSQTVTASFTWRGRTLSVTVPDRSYVESLGHFIGVTPGDAPGDEHFSLTPHPDDAEGLAWSWRHGSGVARSRDDAIASLLTQMCFQFLAVEGCYAMHAAGFVVDGKARLLLGPGHAGKSTLSVEAWLAGREVLGDDYLLLDAATGRVEPVPKPLKLRLPAPVMPERLRPKVPDSGRCIGFVDGLPVVKLARALPGNTPLGRGYEIDAVYVLQRAGTNPTILSPVTKYEAIQAILEQTFVGHARGLGVIEQFAPVIRRGGVRRLAVAENDQATALAVMTAPL